MSTTLPIPLVPQPIPRMFDPAAISAELDKRLAILPDNTKHAIVGTIDLQGASATYVMKFAEHGVWTIEGTLPWHEPIKGAGLRSDIKFAW